MGVKIDNIDINFSFDVGLVETRNHPVRSIGLKTSRNVIFVRLNCCISETETAPSIVVVLIFVPNCHIVHP